MWYKDKEFWQKALGRALRSAAQGASVGIGENLVVWDFNWKLILGMTIGMFIASFATSIGFGIPEYEKNNEE